MHLDSLNEELRFYLRFFSAVFFFFFFVVDVIVVDVVVVVVVIVAVIVDVRGEGGGIWRRGRGVYIVDWLY